MPAIDARLSELGIQLPEPFAPPAGVTFRFERVRLHGGLAYVSGHGPVDGERTLASGEVAARLGVEDAADAARLTALPFDWPVEIEAVVAVRP